MAAKPTACAPGFGRRNLGALDVSAAVGFWGRFTGLMFTSRVAQDRGLLIVDCSSVHTCFMRFPLDLVYLDVDGRASKLVHGLAPWRISAGDPRARHTLELGAGGIRRRGICLGDRLEHPALTRARGS